MFLGLESNTERQERCIIYWKIRMNSRERNGASLWGIGWYYQRKEFQGIFFYHRWRQKAEDSKCLHNWNLGGLLTQRCVYLAGSTRRMNDLSYLGASLQKRWGRSYKAIHGKRRHGHESFCRGKGVQQDGMRCSTDFSILCGSYAMPQFFEQPTVRTSLLSRK